MVSAVDEDARPTWLNSREWSCSKTEVHPDLIRDFMHIYHASMEYELILMHQSVDYRSPFEANVDGFNDAWWQIRDYRAVDKDGMTIGYT